MMDERKRRIKSCVMCVIWVLLALGGEVAPLNRKEARYVVWFLKRNTCPRRVRWTPRSL